MKFHEMLFKFKNDALLLLKSSSSIDLTEFLSRVIFPGSDNTNMEPESLIQKIMCCYLERYSREIREIITTTRTLVSKYDSTPGNWNYFVMKTPKSLMKIKPFLNFLRNLSMLMQA